jgi:hypothetical protein
MIELDAWVVRNRVFAKYFVTPTETAKNPVSLVLMRITLNQLQKSDLQSSSNLEKFAIQSDRSLET